MDEKEIREAITTLLNGMVAYMEASPSDAFEGASATMRKMRGKVSYETEIMLMRACADMNTSNHYEDPQFE